MRDGVGHAHVLRFAFVETVAQFVDEIPVALPVEGGFESLEHEALGGGLVHGFK